MGLNLRSRPEPWTPLTGGPWICWMGRSLSHRPDLRSREKTHRPPLFPSKLSLVSIPMWPHTRPWLSIRVSQNYMCEQHGRHDNLGDPSLPNFTRKSRLKPMAWCLNFPGHKKPLHPFPFFFFFFSGRIHPFPWSPNTHFFHTRYFFGKRRLSIVYNRMWVSE